jgi:hypothetical protein
VEYREIVNMIPGLIAGSRVMANETIATVATPHFANVSAYFINSTNNETMEAPNYGMWFWNALQVYQDFLGPIAYLLIFILPFAMIWIAHGDTRLLCILGLITGPFVFFFVGGAWAAAAVIIMVISVVSLIWRLMRGN